MGSAISKTTRAAPRLGKKDVKNVAVALPISYGFNNTKSQNTPPLDTSRRQGRDEWGDTLNRMSAIISSSKWTETPATATVGDKELPTNEKPFESFDNVHVSQRSAALKNKLPGQRDASKETLSQDLSRETVPGGKLTQESFLLLFRLHREDATQWNAQALSERFQLSPTDVHNLLTYSRTYLGRQDPDGIFRGYYNPDRQNTIVRFERD